MSRSWPILLSVLLAVAPGIASAFWDPITDQCRPPAISGVAEAIDGNTLALTTTASSRIVVRLHAIDAPDLAQTCRAGGEDWDCGLAAKRALAELVDGRELTCLACDQDQVGRTLAVCRAGETDIGAAMVRQGMALGRAFFSNALQSSEAWAKKEGAGLWRGDFVDPVAWRQGKRLGPGPCRGCTDP
jgi:endonuclease YncB( thermonuclease family)